GTPPPLALARALPPSAAAALGTPASRSLEPQALRALGPPRVLAEEHLSRLRGSAPEPPHGAQTAPRGPRGPRQSHPTAHKPRRGDPGGLATPRPPARR